jgi:hypothetical protein
VLASDQVNIVMARGDVERKFDCQPCHGAERVPLAIDGNPFIVPCRI